VTFFEHAMLGIDGALALGLHRRHGWQIVALAGIAAVAPDLDGLTILFGFQCYAGGHRVWGHNLLIAGVVAAMLAAALYYSGVLDRLRAWLARHIAASATLASAEAPRGRWTELTLWLIVAVAAACSHLLMDVFFSIGRDQPIWGVPLLWPFSSREWAVPMVRWGDLGATLILAAGMFAMARWPSRVRAIAAASLAALAAYVTLRGLCG
jgi:membrane-bound metal-dependent hydrolase YbcI (DUF457 family)